MKLLHAQLEIDPLDIDYSVSEYPSGFLVRLMLKANELGLAGKKVQCVEVRENFENNSRYIDFVEYSSEEGGHAHDNLKETA